MCGGKVQGAGSDVRALCSSAFAAPLISSLYACARKIPFLPANVLSGTHPYRPVRFCVAHRILLRSLPCRCNVMYMYVPQLIFVKVKAGTGTTAVRYCMRVRTGSFGRSSLSLHSHDRENIPTSFPHHRYCLNLLRRKDPPPHYSFRTGLRNGGPWLWFLLFLVPFQRQNQLVIDLASSLSLSSNNGIPRNNTEIDFPPNSELKPSIEIADSLSIDVAICTYFLHTFLYSSIHVLFPSTYNHHLGRRAIVNNVDSMYLRTKSPTSTSTISYMNLHISRSSASSATSSHSSQRDREI